MVPSEAFFKKGGKIPLIYVNNKTQSNQKLILIQFGSGSCLEFLFS
jgi:hypothetical protein